MGYRCRIDFKSFAIYFTFFTLNYLVKSDDNKVRKTINLTTCNMEITGERTTILKIN